MGVIMNEMRDNKAYIMMVLSGVAYEDKHDIAQSVKAATDHEWAVTWGPEESLDGSNLAYVAQSQVGTNEVALVIRGTNPLDPFSWWEDFDAAKLVDWPYIMPGYTAKDAQVSKGLKEGLDIMAKFTSNGLSLEDYFVQLHSVNALYVTGHSLGGGLTPLVASWLQYVIYLSSYPVNSGNIRPYSFAGQTPGNAAFAEYINRSLSHGRSWRYYNGLDIVPLGYDHLLEAIDIYCPHITCPEWLQHTIKKLNTHVANDGYTQPDDQGFKLNGDLIGSDSYLAEVGHQHSHKTYIKLVRASGDG